MVGVPGPCVSVNPDATPTPEASAVRGLTTGWEIPREFIDKTDRKNVSCASGLSLDDGNRL